MVETADFPQNKVSSKLSTKQSGWLAFKRIMRFYMSSFVVCFITISSSWSPVLGTVGLLRKVNTQRIISFQDKIRGEFLFRDACQKSHSVHGSLHSKPRYTRRMHFLPVGFGTITLDFKDFESRLLVHLVKYDDRNTAGAQCFLMDYLQW